MNNPHKLKPGEVLSLSLLIERFLDWGIWNESHNRNSRRPDCDEDLFNAHLCCKDHFAVSHEKADFERYYRHLTFRDWSGSAFTIKLLIALYDLEVNIEKILRYFDISMVEWLDIDISEDIYD